MADLIRRKQSGEAWETAEDTGGGGGSLPEGWTQEGDPATVSTNGGTLLVNDGGAVAVGELGGAVVSLTDGGLAVNDEDDTTVVQVDAQGVRSSPTSGDTAFTASSVNGTTVALDGDGMLVKNLAEGVDPSDAATVSQLGGSLSVQAGEGAPVEDVTSLTFANGDGMSVNASEVSPGVASVNVGLSPSYGWVDVQTGVPTAPFTTPFVYDETAVTGGLYAWNGGDYIKIGGLVA